MTTLNDLHVLVTGAGQGLGFAMAKALLARGPRVTAIVRTADRLAPLRQLGADAVVGDAADAALMNRVVGDLQPDVLILNAGARLPMKPIDAQTWDEFSATWNTDVKAGLAGIQAALNTPLKPGARVLAMSSGAAMVMSVPFIDPAGLRLSGGYVGAKRMLWFMAHQANAVSRERGLGLHFQVLVPGQVIPGTALGREVASAYAGLEGVSAEQHVLDRYGSILQPYRFGDMVADLIDDPRHAGGVAYGLRADAGIFPLDVALARKEN
ncbi:SDR family oxidoreductase [Variovorax sp.]|uniref:SDR family oxidoreductase n=1 Tax=Variovorax sp. TaxID=1871043 RepID=UPI002D6E8387|nr:SDR family oxidoreductase [Variovorax sp.]HYP82736.1 SDR family oxidoreductase [Variovorax sp.]